MNSLRALRLVYLLGSGRPFRFMLLALIGVMAPSAQVPTQMDAGISRGDWTTVLTSRGNDPVSRFLRAHALLASGADDQAFCGFTGLQAGWTALTRYCEDGHIEIDNNAASRIMPRRNRATA